MKKNVMNRRLMGILIGFAKVALLFIISGRLDWIMAWIYVVMSGSMLAINELIILPKNPDLIHERTHTKNDAKSWDKSIDILLHISALSMIVLASLDMRFGWSPRFPVWLHVAAFIIGLSGYFLNMWATASNKYFSVFVRIQHDRNQTVVTTGPYKFVRHPGSLGGAIFSASAPLILGSLWAFIPIGFTISLLIVRTIFEDKVLHENLDGYFEYAQKVNYRLLPGFF